MGINIAENTALQALLAFLPILAAGILLVGLRWPAKKTMPIAFLMAAFIAFYAWQMSFSRQDNEIASMYYI